MIDFVLGILGILVSVLLFFVGYRQTVGAKKERIAACNSEVQKILVRRIVLESYTPTRIDVGRLLDGKARDFRVRSDDLLSEAQVLNGVYTRVVESDLIPAEQRHEILNRIVPALVETEERPVDELEAAAVARTRLLSRTTAALGMMALLASAVGALVSALPDLVNLDTTFPTLFKTVSVTAVASLALITLWILLYRLRGSQEDLPTKAGEMDQYVRFEKDIANALRRLGFAIQPIPPGMAGDFVAQQRGRKFLIEVKSWPHRVPARVVGNLAEKLRQTAAEIGNAEIIIVTRTPMSDISDEKQMMGVRILTLAQLKAYLEKHSKNADA